MSAKQLTPAEQYTHDRRQESEATHGSGEVIIRHASLPFGSVEDFQIDRILVKNSKGDLICAKRGGGRMELTLDTIESILLHEPARKEDQEVNKETKKKETLPMTQERLFGTDARTAVADPQAASLLRSKITRFRTTSDDPDERLRATMLLRCLDATSQLRLSRLLPVLSRYARYRFWTPEGYGSTMREWTEHLGLPYRPASFFEIADMVIAEATPSPVPLSRSSLARSEAMLVWGQQYRSMRQSLTTHDQLETIRGGEALHSAIDPVNVEQSALAGRVAVVEDVAGDSITFTSGFRSKEGRSMMLFADGQHLVDCQVLDTSMSDEDLIVADVEIKKNRPSLLSALSRNSTIYACDAPFFASRKSSRVTSNWMALAETDTWSNSETAVRPGRNIPSHIVIAGADFE